MRRVKLSDFGEEEIINDDARIAEKYRREQFEKHRAIAMVILDVVALVAIIIYFYYAFKEAI